jgi:hypothetical protein
MWWQRLLALALAPYATWLVFGYEYHFLDGVNLAFHEAGHLFLSFAGETLHFLGGTLGQLFFPFVLALRFRMREESFESAVCTFWLGESLMNVAVYMGDARAQVLPLVGGHVHDWGWLLPRVGLLEHCESLGRMLHVLASLVVIASWVWLARAAFRERPAPREIAPRPPLFQRQPD